MTNSSIPELIFRKYLGWHLQLMNYIFYAIL